MARICRDCPEKETENIDLEKVEVNQEKRFSFPRLWVSVVAKTLEEAQEKVKALKSEDYSKKSLDSNQ